MLQGPCLSTQTHLMKVLQREQALWNPLLKALRLFLWPLGLPWLRICSCFPITECSGTCGTSTRSFQGAAGLGSAWYPGFLLCRGCWVGVAAAILQVSKLHLFSFLILAPHNFLSACCSPAQSKEDSSFWFVIKVILKISWRDPLCLSSYQIKSRNHVCLFVLLPAVNYFCLLQLSFIVLHSEWKKWSKIWNN